jgi:nucleoside-diphosphate-sugar epimerase
VLFEKFRRGEAVIEGDGLRWINQIHQRDLVAALAHLIEAGAPGEIYNATDDTPVTIAIITRGAASSCASRCRPRSR